MDTRARELVSIGDKLFAKKRQWDELCQDIALNFYPFRADFTTVFTLGDDFSRDLMDSYTVQARETLGNTIGALLRQGDWFSVKTGLEELDEDPANARWLEYATTHFRRLVYDRRANFVRATNEADHDWVAFGNPVLSVEESPDRTHFLFRDWHPKECAWMENAVGRIDHNQRNMPMTARNMKRRWPKTIHSDVVLAAEKEPSKEFKVRHVVLPFEEIYGDDKAKRRQYKDNPFCSLYIDCEHQNVLGEGPLPVFNYVIPRWRTVSSFPQGFSPATINALPDGRMLQSLARILLEQGEKAIDPPMYGRGEIFRDAVNRYAGGLTYVDLETDQKIQDAMMFEQPSNGLSMGMEMKQDVRNLIAESFLLNKINLPPQQKTAFETQARLEEYRRAILPFTGPIESEYHLPLLDIGFQMAVRNKAFNIEDMPKALSDADVTFIFDGPLNTVQGRQNVQAFQESVQILAGGAQFDKTIPAMMDFKQMTKDAVRGTQAPADWFADEQAQEEGADQIDQVAKLTQAAEFLQGGAQVGGQVADTAVKLQQAGLAA
ncbi:portal protein [Mesorhizobium sp. ESP-6-2]|uniref:portal protein n=1 Tax=Mesorhizobium sp. ESP-6-2 TaxID=2876625 RepID=UPI001CCC86C3|nr:portal protein [Mesorhizobium sp. ESP-6-2]MBZ9807688.1 head-tail connector protein [Mesorhizobium sp. ESP-6-2]